MASYIFDQVKNLVALGSLSFVAGDGVFKVALMDATLSDTDTYPSYTKWRDISGSEISVAGNPGYEQGLLINIQQVSKEDLNGTVCDDGLPDIMITANNVVYPVSSITASYAVITRTASGTIGTTIQPNDDLIVALDLRNGVDPITSSEGVFTLRFDESSGGYLIIK